MERGEVSWKVTVMSARGNIPPECSSPNHFGNGLSNGKAMCLLRLSLICSATCGNLYGYSMEFKISLKQNHPLDVQSIAFCRLGFLPSHLWRKTLCALDWIVCREVESPSPRLRLQRQSRRAVHHVHVGPSEGKWCTEDRGGWPCLSWQTEWTASLKQEPTRCYESEHPQPRWNTHFM